MMRFIFLSYDVMRLFNEIFYLMMHFNLNLI